MRGSLILLGLAGLAVGSCGDGSSGGLGILSARGTPIWGQFRNSPWNVGRSGFAATAVGGPEWAVDADGAVTSAIAIDQLGDLWVKGTGNYLLCLSPGGALRWQRFAGPGASTPAIDSFGNGYLGTDDGRVVAFSREGRRLLNATLGSNLGSALIYDEESMVWAAQSGLLSFMTRLGEVTTTLQVGELGETTPVFVSKFQMWVASTDSVLYEILLDPITREPSLGVTLALPGPVRDSTPTSGRGVVFVVTENDVLVAAVHEPFEEEAPRIAWTFDPQVNVGGGGRSSPALGRDGSLYYGTADGRLIAVSSFGAERWTYAAGAPIQSSPVLDQADNLVFRSTDGRIHSLTKDGDIRFVRQRSDAAPGALDSSPSIGTAEAIYVGTASGQVIKLGSQAILGQERGDPRHTGRSGAQGPAQGQLQWTRRLAARPRGVPLVRGDGALQVHLTDGSLVHVNPNGELGSLVPFSGFAESMALGPAGRIYTTTARGEIEGFLSNGAELFSRQLISTGTLSRLTLADDGSLVVASSTGTLFIVKADGSSERRLSCPPVAESAPAISHRGEFVVAGVDGRLQARAESGVLKFEFLLPGAVSHSSPVMDRQGRVFVATDEDVLTAVDSKGVGLWSFDPGVFTQDGGRGGPCLDSGGNVVFITATGVVYGLAADTGNVLYSTDLGSPANVPPRTFAGGGTAATLEDGSVAVLDSAGVITRRLPATAFDGAAMSVPASASGNGGFYVVSDAGSVSLIRDGSPWPQFQGSPAHRGRVGVRGPRVGAVLGSHASASPLTRPAVIAANGDVLVHGETEFVVVAPDHSVRFSFAVAGPGIPAVHPSGIYLVGGSDGLLKAYDEQGNGLWFVTLGGVISGINLGREGEIVVGNGTELLAVNLEGETLWRTSVAGLGEGVPAVDLDGRVWVTTVSGELRSYNSGGALHKVTALPGAAGKTSVAVGPDGMVYGLTEQEILFAVTSSGVLSWQFDPQTGASGAGQVAPVVLADGRVVFGTSNGILYAIDSTGSESFSFAGDSTAISTSAVDGEGVIYFSTASGLLYAVDSAGAQVFSMNVEALFPLTSPTVAADGTLWLGSNSGVLYHVGD